MGDPGGGDSVFPSLKATGSSATGPSTGTSSHSGAGGSTSGNAVSASATSFAGSSTGTGASLGSGSATNNNSGLGTEHNAQNGEEGTSGKAPMTGSPTAGGVSCSAASAGEADGVSLRGPPAQATSATGNENGAKNGPPGGGAAGAPVSQAQQLLAVAGKPAQDFEAEVNSCFQKMYSGIYSVDMVVALLQRLSQAPPGSRDSSLFVSMIRTLFFECRHFPKYPPHELALTAELFGQLIHRHVLINSGNSLMIALRCVLEAIRKGPTSKMFVFGIAALEQFLDRIFLFPQFLVALASLSELQQQHPHYTHYAQSVLLLIPEKYHSLVVLDPRIAASLPPMPDLPPVVGVAAAARQAAGTGIGEVTQTSEPPSGSSISTMLPPPHGLQHPVTASIQQQLAAAAKMMNLSSSPPAAPGNSGSALNLAHNSSLLQGNPVPTPPLAASPTQNVSGNPGSLPGLGQANVPASGTGAVGNKAGLSGLGNAAGSISHTGTLGGVLGAGALLQGVGLGQVEGLMNDHDITAKLEQPPQWVADQVIAVCNSVCEGNVDDKAESLKDVLTEEHAPWLTYYIVKSRAAKEPNLHGIFVLFIEKLKLPGLWDAVINMTYDCIHVLLKYVDEAKESSSYRTLLKNLGLWLGSITLARNRPLKSKRMDLKQLLFTGYEQGHLVAVLPLVCKILEGIKTSKLFKPPNPWTVAVMSLLAEIHLQPNIRTNLVFEVEVLFKHLHLNVLEYHNRTDHLTKRSPPPGSADFVVRAAAAGVAPATAASGHLGAAGGGIPPGPQATAGRPGTAAASGGVPGAVRGTPGSMVGRLPGGASGLSLNAVAAAAALGLGPAGGAGAPGSGADPSSSRLGAQHRRGLQGLGPGALGQLDAASGAHGRLMEAAAAVASAAAGMGRHGGTSGTGASLGGTPQAGVASGPPVPGVGLQQGPGGAGGNAQNVGATGVGMLQSPNQGEGGAGPSPDGLEIGGHLRVGSDDGAGGVLALGGGRDGHHLSVGEPGSGAGLMGGPGGGGYGGMGQHGGPPSTHPASWSSSLFQGGGGVMTPPPHYPHGALLPLLGSLGGSGTEQGSSIGSSGVFQPDRLLQNLSQSVVISPSIALLSIQPNLRPLVPLAVDRAIREIISAVVERSVTISCVTTRELVCKDFCMESEESLVKRAAHLMVASLAGSLALVTCREPLRVSLSQNLRQLLQPAASSDCNDQVLIEQVVQIVSADNLELGCSLIEQAVVEKVLRDIEQTMQPALLVRRQARERGIPFVDTNYINSSRWTLNLPEPVKLRPVLNNRQLQVYKDFLSIGPLKKMQQDNAGPNSGMMSGSGPHGAQTGGLGAPGSTPGPLQGAGGASAAGGAAQMGLGANSGNSGLVGASGSVPPHTHQLGAVMGEGPSGAFQGLPGRNLIGPSNASSFLGRENMLHQHLAQQHAARLLGQQQGNKFLASLGHPQVNAASGPPGGPSLAGAGGANAGQLLVQNTGEGGRVLGSPAGTSVASASIGCGVREPILLQPMGEAHLSTVMARLEDCLVQLRDVVRDIFTCPPIVPTPSTVDTYSTPAGSQVCALPVPHCATPVLTVFACLPSNHEVFQLILAVSAIAGSCPRVEEVAPALAHKLIKSVFEGASLAASRTSHNAIRGIDPTGLYMEVFFAVLAALRRQSDVVSKLAGEVLSISCSSATIPPKKSNTTVAAGLVRYRLVSLAAFDLVLANHLDNGRNVAVLEFILALLKTLLDQKAITPADLPTTFKTLAEAPATTLPAKLVQLKGWQPLPMAEARTKLVEAFREDQEERKKSPHERLTTMTELMESYYSVNPVRVRSLPCLPVTPQKDRQLITMIFGEWLRFCACVSPFGGPNGDRGASTLGSQGGAGGGTSGNFGNTDSASLLRATFFQRVSHQGLLRMDEDTDRFFAVCVEEAIARSLRFREDSKSAAEETSEDGSKAGDKSEGAAGAKCSGENAKGAKAPAGEPEAEAKKDEQKGNVEEAKEEGRAAEESETMSRAADREEASKPGKGATSLAAKNEKSEGEKEPSSEAGEKGALGPSQAGGRRLSAGLASCPILEYDSATVTPESLTAMQTPPEETEPLLDLTPLDAMAKMIVGMMRLVDPVQISPVMILQRALGIVCRHIHMEAERLGPAFNQRPYYRLLLAILLEITAPATKDGNGSGGAQAGASGASGSDGKAVLGGGVSESQVLPSLLSFAEHLALLSPTRVPAFAFAWLGLVGHRLFMPRLLKSGRGWATLHRLLLLHLEFLQPLLRNVALSDSIRLLYKGALRILLVLLHDFPEFLCEYHFSFCDVLPLNCVQLRNVVLSAFPRNMKLPDPFLPNLKVDLLADIKTVPRILSSFTVTLLQKGLKKDIDAFWQTRDAALLPQMKAKFLVDRESAVRIGTKYDVSLLNAFLLYVGTGVPERVGASDGPALIMDAMLGIASLGGASGARGELSPSLEILLYMSKELDMEGRYLLMSALANHLRYPNAHTHYFSCVLLWLFGESRDELIQEQITRVLLERLIVHRPHPWGLLITFIELIKNPRFNFWSCSFVSAAPEVEKLFQSVAHTCLGQSGAQQLQQQRRR
ncbi:CCR4-Not complex component, Not1 protein [Toxoplasma gondii VEG]|uniref:CCR4-Not complex component, Not1 protein n=1 Tax=Toxoplasma gondii (strain ATCC 50861 / VEG) TaxID=432359 RepID=B9QEC7_TOXGV|nr:CCR4-Not complex component, Not1 protein [Toxoplasma gondii VEG]